MPGFRALAQALDGLSKERQEGMELSNREKIGPWVPVVVFCLVIFLLSSIPGSSLFLPGRFNKLYHLVEYSVLGALLFLAARSSFGLGAAKAVMVAFAFSLLYGISDEWHQSFVPGRFSSWGDVAADGLGGLLGALLAPRLLDGCLSLRRKLFSP